MSIDWSLKSQMSLLGLRLGVKVRIGLDLVETWECPLPIKVPIIKRTKLCVSHF